MHLHIILILVYTHIWSLYNISGTNDLYMLRCHIRNYWLASYFTGCDLNLKCEVNLKAWNMQRSEITNETTMFCPRCTKGCITKLHARTTVNKQRHSANLWNVASSMVAWITIRTQQEIVGVGHNTISKVVKHCSTPRLVTPVSRQIIYCSTLWIVLQ